MLGLRLRSHVAEAPAMLHISMPRACEVEEHPTVRVVVACGRVEVAAADIGTRTPSLEQRADRPKKRLLPLHALCPRQAIHEEAEARAHCDVLAVEPAALLHGQVLHGRALKTQEAALVRHHVSDSVHHPLDVCRVGHCGCLLGRLLRCAQARLRIRGLHRCLGGALAGPREVCGRLHFGAGIVGLRRGLGGRPEGLRQV